MHPENTTTGSSAHPGYHPHTPFTQPLVELSCLMIKCSKKTVLWLVVDFFLLLVQLPSLERLLGLFNCHGPCKKPNVNSPHSNQNLI